MFPWREHNPFGGQNLQPRRAELQAWEAQKWVLGVMVNGATPSPPLWLPDPGGLPGPLQITFSGLAGLVSLGSLLPSLTLLLSYLVSELSLQLGLVLTPQVASKLLPSGPWLPASLIPQGPGPAQQELRKLRLASA